MVWQLQTAKQRFSELVERARSQGPQVVSKHGREAVVVIAIEEYRELRAGSLIDAIRSAPDLDLLDLTRSDDPGRDVAL